MNALLLVLIVLFVVGIPSTWFAGRWFIRRERQEVDALGAAIQATVARRSIKETMGHLLEATVQSLHAERGAIHLIDKDAGCLRLLYAVDVVQLGQLTFISPDDPLVAHLKASDDGALIGKLDDPSAPWSALAGQPGAVIATARISRVTGRGATLDGIITLGWSSYRAAKASETALLNISRYAGQVLSEFEEIEQRARDIQALSAELQRREALARTTAHDLLNKLTTAYGAMSILLTDSRLTTPERELMEQGLTQMTLVNQMLEDLRDPNRPIQPERVRVEDLVELAAGMMVSYQASLPIEFSLDVSPDLPDVWGERLQILRVLDNLLTNAVRHNSDSLPVRIWLRVRRASEVDADAVEFEVGDDGVGISPGTREQLFGLDFEANSAGKIRGHGLGLWSCRRIVEAHGGHIWVESRADEGARFFFTLPVAVD